MKILSFLLALTSVAFAKDFNVTDQDQVAIQTICDTASLSPAMNREPRAQIAAWCVNWQKRMEEANKPPKPEEPAK